MLLMTLSDRIDGPMTKQPYGLQYHGLNNVVVGYVPQKANDIVDD